MQLYLLKLRCLCFVAVVIFITQEVSGIEVRAAPLIDRHNIPHNNDVAYGPGYTDVENYYDIFEEAAKLFPYNGKRSSRIHVFRRGCIPRGGACDSRPNGCCYNSSCRCNLWGSNCRCQRMGLFQKWG
ncbi:uncharacterized protein [Bactrocera oleae]|uniref:uncharacterized protein n=1 Tax=Bactrocera oleae TaxID=104688 RepID=UPI0006B84964|nr:uncharacterized protein LOC106624679 [Bactrocera oleae]XP_036232599.1 uncharacterized protein LOC106624679 [Bactrocera oleae]